MRRYLLFLFSVFCALSVLTLARTATAQADPVPTQAGPLVTIDVTDAPLRTVLATLFSGTGKSYMVGTFSTDKVTLHIHGLPFQIALAALLTAARPALGYEITDDGTYYFVHLSARVGVVGDPPSAPVNYDTHVYLIPVRNVPAEYILDAMRGALTGGLQPIDWQSSPLASEVNYIMIDKRNNSFLLAATVDGFSNFKEIVKNLDQPTPLKEKTQK